MKPERSNHFFARMYLWMTKAKSTMGLFFTAFVFYYLFLGLLLSKPPIMLDFFVALEMVFACFFIGVLQQAVLPLEHIGKVRILIWTLGSTAITLVFSLFFGWFSPFPSWVFVLFLVFVIFSVMAMVLAYRFDLQRETSELNEKLAQYQNSKD